MKRPNAVHFTKKNELKPFEDEEKLEFFSQKNDSAFVVVGTHSKKRPHNLVFTRMLNHQVLDMYEFGIENPKSMSSISVSDFVSSMKLIGLIGYYFFHKGCQMFCWLEAFDGFQW